MGSLSLLQGIFPTQVSPRSPALQADALPAEPQEKPKKVGVGFPASSVGKSSFPDSSVGKKKKNPLAMQETLVQFLGRSAGGGRSSILGLPW